MTKLLYHPIASSDSTSPFDKAILNVADSNTIKMVSPYIGLIYLQRIIDVSTSWLLISDIHAWLSSPPTSERAEIFTFIRANSEKIHHYPDIHAKTVISTEQAYLGSANLTSKGIQKRTEMGVLLEDAHLVQELNDWFDELWNKTSSPDIDETAALIKSLDEQPQNTAINSKKIPISSNAPPVRSRLVDLDTFLEKTKAIKPNNKENKQNQKNKSTANAILLLIDRIFSQSTSIDLSSQQTSFDNYLTILIHTLSFNEFRPIQENHQSCKLTGLSEAYQSLLVMALKESELLDTDERHPEHYILREEFQWLDRLQKIFSKAYKKWNNKISSEAKPASNKIEIDVTSFPYSPIFKDTPSIITTNQQNIPLHSETKTIQTKEIKSNKIKDRIQSPITQPSSIPKHLTSPQKATRIIAKKEDLSQVKDPEAARIDNVYLNLAKILDLTDGSFSHKDKASFVQRLRSYCHEEHQFVYRILEENLEKPPLFRIFIIDGEKYPCKVILNPDADVSAYPQTYKFMIDCASYKNGAKQGFFAKSVGYKKLLALDPQNKEKKAKKDAKDRINFYEKADIVFNALLLLAEQHKNQIPLYGKTVSEKINSITNQNINEILEILEDKKSPFIINTSKYSDDICHIKLTNTSSSELKYMPTTTKFLQTMTVILPN